MFVFIYRRHCLVYVSDSGRLYGFGSEANGQLCTNSTDVKPLPVAIKGPFVAYSNTGKSTNSGKSSSFVINTVAAGGDYCFVWAVSEQVLSSE